jgi:hypothetical protein
MTGALLTYGQGTYGSDAYGGEAEVVPAFTVEVLNGANAWEPIECDVRSIDIQRGRSSQLDSFAAATCSVALADASDYYSAWNPSGLWAQHGRFRVDVPIRVSVVLGFTVSRLFTGTTDEVIDSWPGAGADALTEVRATDALKGLARARPPKLAVGIGAGDLPGPRIGRVLDAVGYTGARNLEAGTITLLATVMDDTALNLADQARECEWGSLYADSSGTLRFRARDALVTDPRQANVQWTFDDQDREGPCYSDLKLTANDDQVYNSVTITRGAGTTPQVATVADSLGWYGPRTYTRDLPIDTDAGALTLAQTIAAQNAYNERRVDAIVLDPQWHPELWPAAIGVRMLDRVRVIRRTGVVIDTELLVQSIHHAITGGGDGHAGTWTTTLETANAVVVRDAGQWDIGLWDQAVWSV